MYLLELDVRVHLFGLLGKNGYTNVGTRSVDEVRGVSSFLMYTADIVLFAFVSDVQTNAF